MEETINKKMFVSYHNRHYDYAKLTTPTSKEKHRKQD